MMCIKIFKTTNNARAVFMGNLFKVCKTNRAEKTTIQAKLGNS